MATDVSGDRIRAIYERRAATYDRTVGFGERWLLGNLRQTFGTALRGETLEVAIGTGLNLPYYTAAVTDAVGIDLSPGMLSRARERAGDLSVAISLVSGDADRLPFADASFDTVAISLALCTVPEPAVALQEMARVCRPDGRIVLLEHVRSPVGLVYGAERLLSPLQERLIGCHLTRETIDTARKLGFTIESEERRLFAVFRLVVARPPRAMSERQPVAAIGRSATSHPARQAAPGS